MAQICVVNCSFCETFQGQQVKMEGTKWTCKMCGEKQSFRKIFAQGSGKECRQVVQRLNMITGNSKRQMLEENCVERNSNEKNEQDNAVDKDCSKVNQIGGSKWNQFVSTDVSDSEETENDNGDSFTTERATFNKFKTQKRKRLMQDKMSEDVPEYKLKKPARFDPSKGVYPPSKSSNPRQENLDQNSGDEEQTYSNKISTRKTCSTTETCGLSNVSKWSKYT